MATVVRSCSYPDRIVSVDGWITTALKWVDYPGSSIWCTRLQLRCPLFLFDRLQGQHGNGSRAFGGSVYSMGLIVVAFLKTGSHWTVDSAVGRHAIYSVQESGQRHCTKWGMTVHQYPSTSHGFWCGVGLYFIYDSLRDGVDLTQPYNSQEL